jgi:hypothetical protein
MIIRDPPEQIGELFERLTSYELCAYGVGTHNSDGTPQGQLMKGNIPIGAETYNPA